ncbi:MAG: TolC family protein [Candidatus Thiodiazotropha endolucinida]
MLGKIGQENSHNFNRIDGHLLPGELPALSKVLGGADQYPVLVQRSQQAEAARLNARSVASSHIPELTFGVGHKAIDRPGADESGLMPSASVALPLFDRRQGEQQQARAKAIQAESEYQLASQQLRAEIRSLWTKADQTSTNARLFSEQNVAPSFELVRIAEASYDANEIGVLELIDAYRSALDAEISALTLAIDARLVRIDLDAMTDGIRP